MVTRKTGTLLITSFLFLFALSGNAFALACFNTNITRIGQVEPASVPNSTGVRIEVNGGSCAIPDNTAFYVSADLGNGGLAILLSAFALNKPVTMIVDSTAAGSLVFRVHIDAG